MTTTASHPTTWKEHFANSPRLKAIESLFETIKNPKLTVNEIWAKAGKVMQGMSGEERDAFPEFIKNALVDRDPVRATPLAGETLRDR